MLWAVNRILGTTVILAFAATAACDQTPAVSKKLPDGEDAFSCGALIYAAANKVDGDEYQADLKDLKANAMVTVTKYGTIYATPLKFDGYEAFTRMKLKAMAYTGTPSGNSDELPTAEIVERAKACAEAA